MMMKNILKSHKDVSTVPEEINRLYQEYQEIGYSMLDRMAFTFAYKLEDGTIIDVYWENGMIYEKVR